MIKDELVVRVCLCETTSILFFQNGTAPTRSHKATYHICWEMVFLVLLSVSAVPQSLLRCQGVRNVHRIAGNIGGLVTFNIVGHTPISSLGYIESAPDSEGTGIQANSCPPWGALTTVDFLILEICLIREISLHGQMLTTRTTFKTLLMENHPVDGPHFFGKEHCVITPLTTFRTWGIK